ncbi:YheC/D like ATP-grasp [Planifilum fulgidum]|jgi:glutathione synthase/RimK-type ligase-like ATP-grasp enzyme|uniref:YheC/D like ATP-grasp n=1 Tax=Planifilum fulgidum TaxID=201973 RepID=A0A1I2N4C1_9BACL|nr:YheC/YheD family protein [Planifilum fulgidum]SFF98612.1 YheC/D like ATP-grasp [Planifilum fulgidum]
MGFARCEIQVVPDHTFPQSINMVMSRSLAEKLHLAHFPVWVKFGSKVAKGWIAVHSAKSSLIRISSKLARSLRLPDHLSLCASYDPQSHCLRIGPFLGILINTQATPNQPIFGAMTRFLEECALTGQERGVCVAVFTPEQIMAENGTTKGWLFQSRKWQLRELPFPDVLYNRITSRRIERRPRLQNILRFLRMQHGVCVFNKTFLDKRQVHETLMRDPRMQNMLPETHPYHPHRIRPMLNRHGILYLKPTNGSLGSGIIRLIKTGRYIVCQYATANGTTTRVYRKVDTAITHLNRRVKGSSYLIQQGLHLVTSRGRPVDFRVLVQKNLHGNWAITSVVGRIANDQHIVSNLARGGTVRKASDVLAELDPHQSKPSISKIRSTALEVANTFEELVDGHYAELGIDLAVDKSGKIWLLEINSKPSKTDDTVINPSLTTRPSVIRLIEYTLYLTRFAHARGPFPQPRNAAGRKRI